MKEYKVPIQSLIDHIKTAVDVDPWAKEMTEELLKEQVPLEPYACEGDMMCGNGCEIVGYIRESDGKIECLANYCPYCGRPVKWD